MIRLNTLALRVSRGACVRMPAAKAAPLLFALPRQPMTLSQLRLMSSAAKPKFDPTAPPDEASREANAASRGVRTSTQDHWHMSSFCLLPGELMLPSAFM